MILSSLALLVLPTLFLARSIYTLDKSSNTTHKDEDQITHYRNGMMARDITIDLNVASISEEYFNMVTAMSQDEQRKLLIKSVPKKVEEALDLVVREVMLFQQIYLEQIKAIEAFKARPQAHKILLAHFQHYEHHPARLYQDAKLIVAWCNILVRYAGWIVRNLNKARNQVDRLFKMLFLPYHLHLNVATAGLETLFDSAKKLRYSEIYTLFLYKFRELYITPAANIRQTVWFHDNVSPALLFYSTACHLLWPFVKDSVISTLIKIPEDINDWPKEWNMLAGETWKKLKPVSSTSPLHSLNYITGVWTDLSRIEEYKIITDWWDERVNDRDFEKSYIDPLGLRDKKTKLETSFLKDDEDAKKFKKGSSKRKKKNKKSKISASSASLASSIITEIRQESSEIPNIPDVLPTSANDKSIDGAADIAGAKSRVDIAVDDFIESDSVLLMTSDKEQLKGKVGKSDKEERKEEEEITDDWEDEVLREREFYLLEKKKMVQIRKVIRQQKAEQEKSDRQAKVRQNMKGGLEKCKVYTTIIDSTELCLAYSDSYNLFLSNKHICSIKARQFRWFFDPNVVIQQEHMDFLCILFNLQPGKGQLSFTDMTRTFCAIESCFCKENDTKGLKKPVFKWSHRFEINMHLCPPFKKEIHPEHQSSRFNHSQAHELFSSGGFDPHFFTPIY